MSILVERLRDGSDSLWFADRINAADRIEQLEAALRDVQNDGGNWLASDLQRRIALLVGPGGTSPAGYPAEPFVPTGAGGNPRAFVCCEGVGKHESWCSALETEPKP